LVLIRHGESNVTVRRVIGGYRTCDGLSDLGRRQAERLRRRLAETEEFDADVLVASNFARAIETAEIIRPAFGETEIEIDAAVGEHDPGPELDGMSFVDYVDRFGTPDWAGDPHVEMFPGGETTAEFHLRVGAAVSRLVRTHAGSTIAVACHGGVIDAAFRHFMRFPAAGGFALRTVNCSLTEFVIPTDGPAVLARYNDAAHLAGLPEATARQQNPG
jgi:probable phosphoglycerate mutase